MSVNFNYLPDGRLAFLNSLFDTSDFPARWNCGNWSSAHGWVHILSDVAIASAYAMIPLAIAAYCWVKRNELAFPRVLWLFAAFIFSCGTAHLVEAIIFYHPVYRFSGLVKVITAVVSWATVIAIIRVAPQALELPGLRRVNQQLQSNLAEIGQARDHLNVALKEAGDLRTALDAHAIVAITDARGRITYVNDKFCAISQFSRDELIGKDHRIINSGHHPKEFFQGLWKKIGRGEVWSGEIRNKAKDGSHYWVDTTIVPFLDEAGVPFQYIAIRNDITQRKLAEENVRLLNDDLEQRVIERTAQLESANKELEAFSYSVSHDLRAPLRAVDGYSQAVIDDFGPQMPDEGQKYLQTIRNSAQKMGMLIDDLLTFSRLSRASLNRRQVDTIQLVHSVLDDLAAERANRAIDLRIGELPDCSGDPALLRQVWVNLISNALKYTRKCELAVVEIGHETTAKGTIYFVRDNGTGFDMRYVEKLFGVFQRLHRAEEYEGTGVGLALVQRIIHRHGGRVWAEAEPGRGATLFFTLGNEGEGGRESNTVCRISELT